MSSPWTRLYLGASGALLAVIGTGLLLFPQETGALSEVIYRDDPGLLSEVRASGSVLVLAGCYGLIAAWRTGWMQNALGVCAGIYGGYALSRILGCVMDGWPNDAIANAFLVELILAILSAALWLRCDEASLYQVEQRFEREAA